MDNFFCMSRRVPVFNVGCNGLSEHICHTRLARRSDEASMEMDIGALDKNELRRLVVNF